MELAEVCATTGFPVPEAGAVTAQPVPSRAAPQDLPIQSVARLPARCVTIDAALRLSQQLIRPK